MKDVSWSSLLCSNKEGDPGQAGPYSSDTAGTSLILEGVTFVSSVAFGDYSRASLVGTCSNALSAYVGNGEFLYPD